MIQMTKVDQVSSINKILFELVKETMNEKTEKFQNIFLELKKQFKETKTVNYIPRLIFARQKRRR